jgi:hypothetical protein
MGLKFVWVDADDEKSTVLEFPRESAREIGIKRM